MYEKKQNGWDFKVILAGFALAAIIITCSSWAEAAAEHSCDYHVDTSNDDQRSAERAERDSKDDGSAVYSDSKGDTHVYINGNELS